VFSPSDSPPVFSDPKLINDPLSFEKFMGEPVVLYVELVKLINDLS
jgi:hypothetical protein